MGEKKSFKISLKTYLLTMLILLLVIGVLLGYIVYTGKNIKITIENASQVEEILEEEKQLQKEELIETIVNEVEEDVVEEETEEEFFVLYNGYEIKTEPGLYGCSDMEKTDESETKYNTKYYNYENGKYEGSTDGEFGEETYEGYSVVSNVKRIAMTEKYDAIPREKTIIEELPEELSDLEACTTVDIHEIDLDGDKKVEHVVCYTINIAAEDSPTGKPVASSTIALYDEEYKKIEDLVILEDGFWANIEEEDRKIFLSLDKVEYIDIDKDEVMEIVIEVPTYEIGEVSVIKYKDGKVEGEVEHKASVEP